MFFSTGRPRARAIYGYARDQGIRATERRALLAQLVGIAQKAGGERAMALPYLDATLDDLAALDELATEILRVR